MVEIQAEKMKEEGTEGVVDVKPKPSKGLTSKAVDWLEKLIVNLLYHPSAPQFFLAGNFTPISDETPPFSDLPVTGHLPVSHHSFLSISFFPD